MEAGLDSLGAVELRNALGAKFGTELPATVTFDYPSVSALARFLGDQAPDQTPDAGEAAAGVAGLPRSLADVKEEVQHIVATMLGTDVTPDQVQSFPSHEFSSISLCLL